MTTTSLLSIAALFMVSFFGGVAWYTLVSTSPLRPRSPAYPKWVALPVGWACWLMLWSSVATFAQQPTIMLTALAGFSLGSLILWEVIWAVQVLTRLPDVLSERTRGVPRTRPQPEVHRHV